MEEYDGWERETENGSEHRREEDTRGIFVDWEQGELGCVYDILTTAGATTAI